MIRPATPADLPALLALGAAMHAESPEYSVEPFEPDVLEATLREVLAEGGALVAEGPGGQLVGGVLGYTTTRFFNRRLVGSELGVFLRPEHRGGTAAVRLVRALERWSTSQGAQQQRLGVTTGVHTDRTRQLYEALGYRLVGVLLAKPLNPAP